MFLTAKAIGQLKDIGIAMPPAQTPPGFLEIQRHTWLCKQLKSKGVRVTGLIQASRPNDRYADYFIVVDEPRNFRVNLQFGAE